MKKFTFFLSIIAIILSIITIVLFFYKVSPNSIVDSDTFISTIVGVLSLAITLLIGYQIYNAIELNDRMKVIKKDVDNKLGELNTIKNNIEELKNEFRQGGYILQARLFAGKSLEQHNAFLRMLSAIRAALDVDNRQEGYGWMIDELKEYMLMINNTYPFSGSSNEIPHKIQEYKNYFKKDDKAIRNHDNYFFIRDRYEVLMKEFDKRLNYIAQSIAVSENEVGKPQEEA